MKYDNRIKYIFKCVYYTNVMIGDDRYDRKYVYYVYSRSSLTIRFLDVFHAFYVAVWILSVFYILQIDLECQVVVTASSVLLCYTRLDTLH